MDSERKKIIGVDDNLENLTALKNTLKDIYEVFPCPSAAKMFDLIEHIQPDLILLDIEMPDMNGYEALKQLKNSSAYREIPVIFLTSISDAQSEMEGLRLGAVDYIYKPFAAPLLLQRIKMHLALIDHQVEARNASRAKGEFLSHMSHEIRTPLNAITGMINIAAGTEDIKKINYCLERAGSASKHLLNIINNILDISKIEANKFELSYCEFDLRKMITNIVDITSVRAEEKHQHIAVYLGENVPSSITGDELRLSQVITNLLTNAIKFTPEKGAVTLRVEMTGESGDEVTLRTEVADSGIGITEEQQKRLFTSYSQADSSIAKNFGGTGLGLAISKRVVELMQGRIWVESELNKGARFIFTIKAGKGTGSADKDSPPRDGSGEKDFAFSEYTILVADDDEINREIMAALLEKTGISIDFAENGKKAVHLFQEHPERYDMILMDVHMPEMDGYEATRTIRASGSAKAKNIRIIALTADVFREDIEKCLSAGMDSHIGKPIDSEVLYKTLKKYLPPL